MHTDLGGGMTLIDGQFVSVEIERVVLAIKDYEPELDVEWLPPGARKDENGEVLPAFKIWHRPEGKPPFLLFTVASEKDFDIRVLQRIIVNDHRNGVPKYDDIRAMEEAAKRVAYQEYLDKMEEAADITAHILKTKLHTYKVNGDLVINDSIPFNAKLLEPKWVLDKREQEE